MSTHSELAHDVTELSFWPAWTTILAERQDALKADIASARRTLGHGCVLSPLAEGPGSDAVRLVMSSASTPARLARKAR